MGLRFLILTTLQAVFCLSAWAQSELPVLIEPPPPATGSENVAEPAEPPPADVAKPFTEQRPETSKLASATVWYKPFYFAQAMSNHASVTLFGKTTPGRFISIDKTQVITENPDMMAGFADLAKNDSFSATADVEGNFQLSLTLPMGLTQIPVAVKSEDGDETYVIGLQIDKKKVAMNVPTLPDQPSIAKLRADLLAYTKRKMGLVPPLGETMAGVYIYAGAGISAHEISQTLNSNTELKFSRMNYPALVLRATMNNKTWNFTFDYRRQEGKVGAVSAPFTATSKTYPWTTMLLESGFNIRNAYFGEKMRVTALGGLQQHQLPFFQVLRGNEISNQTLNFTTLSLGAMLTSRLSKKYIFETYLHLQQPLGVSTLGSGRNETTPKFAFDGSVGIIKQLRKGNRYIGYFWSGQWQEFSFTYPNTLDNSVNNGQEKLFYSNLDVRYIWRF